MAISARKVLCICSLFLLLLLTWADDCPKDFMRLGDKCISVYLDKVNWFDADRKCRSTNANLLTFENDVERSLTTEYLKNMGIISKSYYNDSIWIGINTLGKNRTFVQAKNGKNPNYVRWCTNQPDNDNQECVAYADFAGCNYGYHDYDCTSVFPFVCETKVRHESNYLCLPRNNFVEVYHET